MWEWVYTGWTGWVGWGYQHWVPLGGSNSGGW